MNPPAPGPVSGLSLIQATNAAAMHASTALPPSSRAWAPAAAVKGWPAATAPLMAGGYARPGSRGPWRSAGVYRSRRKLGGSSVCVSPLVRREAVGRGPLPIPVAMTVTQI